MLLSLKSFFLKSSFLKLRLAQLSLIIVFLLVGITISLTAPLMQGSDQIAHFYFIRFIAKNGRLPMTWEERAEAGYKSGWPPLFHIMTGLVGRSIDLDAPPFIKVTDRNPRLQLVFGTDDLVTSRALTTADPYRSEVLLWYLGRWLTLFCALIDIVATYLLVRAFYPDQPGLALSAAALLGFTPAYVLNSGVTNYDALLGMLLTFYFLLLFYTIKYPTQSWFYFGLGLLMGLASLTRHTSWLTISVLLLIVGWLAYKYQWTSNTTIWRFALVGLGLVLTLGSWFLYTVIYFNNVARLGWIYGLLSPFLTDPIDPTSRRMAAFVSGGVLGGMGESKQGGTVFDWFWNITGGIWRGRWLTWMFLGLWTIVLVGLTRQWRRGNQPVRLWLILLNVHISTFLIIFVLRFLLTGNANTVEGHQVFFPAGAAMMLLLIWGLNVWLTSRYLTVVFLVAAILCLGQSIFSVTQVYQPPWPIRTVPLSNSEQVLATFDKMSLIGYEQIVTDQTLQITLQWRAEGLLNEDYSLELTLFDDKGQAQARWLGQPLNGRYPTRAWGLGDRVRDVIHIPVAGLSPGDYQIQLRLLSQIASIHPTIHPSFLSSFHPVIPTLEMQDHLPQPFSIEVDSLRLGHVTLVSPSPSITADTVLLNGQEIGYNLWPENRPTVGMPVYRERSTIVFSTDEYLQDQVRLSLVGPDNQPHEPVDQTGYIYNFRVEPHFASGQYCLRFEQWSDVGMIDQVETADLLRIQTEKRQFEIAQVSNPVMANFAGQVALLGYDLPQRRVQAGGNLPITLYWQALRTMGDDFIMFNHLINEQQELWGGNDRLAHEIYSTILWAPGEIVTDSFNVRVKADAPDGIYRLLVGLYLPVGQEALSLHLMQDGQLTDISSVNIGPIKVGNTPTGFAVEIANPQRRLNQPFGDAPNLTLLGYDLDQSLIDNCQLTVNCQLTITLYWRSEAPLPLDYTVFVHIRNSAGEIVAQKDQPPLKGAYPTSLWDPGEIITDEITIPLPVELPAGEYKIVIGMYDFSTGMRLAIPGNPENSLTLSTMEIN